MCIAMSRAGKVLVAGMDGGIIRSFRQPLTYENEWFDFKMHVDSVNAVSCEGFNFFTLILQLGNWYFRIS